MSDFCYTCYGEEFLHDFVAYSSSYEKFQNCESASCEWFTSRSFCEYLFDQEKRFTLISQSLGFDKIPSEKEFSPTVMICEGCSRSGSLICVVDNAGYCIDPNCNIHGQINVMKGWYEIGGDIKRLGEYRNKMWD